MQLQGKYVVRNWMFRRWDCSFWLTFENFPTFLLSCFWVIFFLQEIKAFYMRENEDGKTVAAMDVLVPRVLSLSPILFLIFTFFWLFQSKGVMYEICLSLSLKVLAPTRVVH